MTSRKSIFLPSRAIGALMLFVVFAMTSVDGKSADIQWRNPQGPLKLFGGGTCNLELQWSNTTAHVVEMPIFVRLSEATSATTAPWSYEFWKRLTILPTQTILESAELSLPAVRARTLFVAQWATRDGQVLGTSRITVFPTNLLEEVAVLAGGRPIGLFDPSDFFQGTFKGLETFDLDAREPARFEGKLAVVYQASPGSSWPPVPAASIKSLARRGISVVWIKEPPDRSDELVPSFTVVRKGTGSIVMAQSGLVANLSHDPQAQLNLVELARTAVCPHRFLGNSQDIDPEL